MLGLGLARGDKAVEDPVDVVVDLLAVEHADDDGVDVGVLRQLGGALDDHSGEATRVLVGLCAGVRGFRLNCIPEENLRAGHEFRVSWRETLWRMCSAGRGRGATRRDGAHAGGVRRMSLAGRGSFDTPPPERPPEHAAQRRRPRKHGRHRTDSHPHRCRSTTRSPRTGGAKRTPREPPVRCRAGLARPPANGVFEDVCESCGCGREGQVRRDRRDRWRRCSASAAEVPRAVTGAWSGRAECGYRTGRAPMPGMTGGVCRMSLAGRVVFDTPRSGADPGRTAAAEHTPAHPRFHPPRMAARP